MTLQKTENGTTSLSAGSWVGLVITVVLSLGGQAFLFHGRVVTLEANRIMDSERINSLEIRMDATRREILDELRAIRAELKSK